MYIRNCNQQNRKDAIKKKNKLFILFKSTNCMSILNRYKKLKNKIKKNIKHDKNNYYKQLFSHNNKKTIGK